MIGEFLRFATSEWSEWSCGLQRKHGAPSPDEARSAPRPIPSQARRPAPAQRRRRVSTLRASEWSVARIRGAAGHQHELESPLQEAAALRDASPRIHKHDEAELERCVECLARAVVSDPQGYGEQQVQGMVQFMDGMDNLRSARSSLSALSVGKQPQAVQHVTSSSSISARSSGSSAIGSQPLHQLSGRLEAMDQDRAPGTPRSRYTHLEPRVRELCQQMRSGSHATAPTKEEVSMYREAAAKRRQGEMSSAYDHVVHSLAEYHEWSYATGACVPEPGERRRERLPSAEVARNVRLLQGMSSCP